jgi:hypothetical protein
MTKIGISIDYSNICKDYNTVYLDRDNDDKETTECMKKVMEWIADFLDKLMKEFNYKIFRLNNSSALGIDEISRKRFLFYSLEKEMLLQNFILQDVYSKYISLAQWAKDSTNSMMIKNDDDGEGIDIYFEEHSSLHKYILEELKDFSLEVIEFNEK